MEIETRDERPPGLFWIGASSLVKIWRLGTLGFRGEATRYRTTYGFRLRGCRGKEDERDLARGCCGETWRVGVAGNPWMIWRAEDAVRAGNMNGRGET